MLRKRLSLLCCVLLFLPLLACGHVEEEPAPDPAPVEPVAPIEPAQPEEPPAPINPLTGLADDISQEKAERVPISVMVSNSYNSLPQWGISQADIIFEMIAEGRITRFLALFQDPSDLEALGSIRSARPYYIDIAQGFTPIYIHFGGSVPAYDLIGKRKDLIDMDGIRGGYEGSLYVRDPSRRKSLGLEHSVITNGQRIEDALAGLDRDLKKPDSSTAFSFDEQHGALTGEAAAKVTLTFSNKHKPWFEYDAQSGKYLRYQYGAPHTDAWYNQQIAVTNLFVLRMPLRDVPNSELHLVEVGTTGKGDGYYCCGGKWVPITWQKDSYSAPLLFFDSSGAPLKVCPGNSFVSVVTETADVTIE